MSPSSCSKGQEACSGVPLLGFHSARSAPSFLKRPFPVASSFWPLGSTCAPPAGPMRA